MIDQRTEEWRSQRAGKITASGFADAIAMNKKKPTEPTAARMTYMRTIVAEILSGRPKHEITSKSLSWGTEAEEFARQAYELETGLVVVQSEFVTHYDYDFIGASPDGLIGTDGGIEMKSPHDEQVHIGTWLNGMPDDHIAQVQGNMMVTGRQWWDFVSYDPRQAEKYQLYIQRIARDDTYINETLLPGLLKFWAEVQQMLKRIQDRAA
jgi:predicted phage-related endonuclease